MLIAVLLGIGAAGASAGTARAEPPQGPVLMVVGDSISHGQEGDFTWRYRLWEHLRDSGSGATFTGPGTGTFDFYDSSDDGTYRVPQTTWDSRHDAFWGQALWQKADSIAGEIQQASPRPTTLLVELGTNDLQFGSSAADVLATMDRFVAQVRSVAPTMTLLIADVPGRTPLGDPDLLAPKERDYNAQLRGYVTAHTTAASPLVFVDLTNGWDANLETHDGLHPNEAGEWLLASDFADSLAGIGIGAPMSAASPTPLPTLAQTAPAISVTSGAGTSAPTLTWTRSYGADGYRLYQRDVTASGPLAPLPLAIHGTSWTTRFWFPDHTYAYAVRALRGEGTPTDTSSPLGPEVLTIPPGCLSLSRAVAPTTLRLSFAGLPGLPRSLALAHAASFGDRRCDGLARAISLQAKTRSGTVELHLTLRSGRWVGTIRLARPKKAAVTWRVSSPVGRPSLNARHAVRSRVATATATLTWSLGMDVRAPALAG